MRIEARIAKLERTEKEHAALTLQASQVPVLNKMYQLLEEEFRNRTFNNLGKYRIPVGGRAAVECKNDGLFLT